MRRLTLSLTLLLVGAFAVCVPGVAGAQSGLDEYQEGVPTPGGEAPGVPGPGDGGGGNGAGSAGSSDTSGTAAGSGVSSGAAGQSAGAGSGSVTERQAAAAGSTPSGQLPATGLDETAVMALVGLSLLVGGLLVRRTSRREERSATAGR
jgi:LPXTG-motif cell wall-anchored protein